MVVTRLESLESLESRGSLSVSDSFTVNLSLGPSRGPWQPSFGPELRTKVECVGVWSPNMVLELW